MNTCGDDYDDDDQFGFQMADSSDVGISKTIVSGSCSRPMRCRKEPQSLNVHLQGLRMHHFRSSPPASLSCWPSAMSQSGNSKSSSLPLLSSTPPGVHSSSIIHGCGIQFPPIVGYHHEDASKKFPMTSQSTGRIRADPGFGDSLLGQSQHDHSGSCGVGGSGNRGPATAVVHSAALLRLSRDPTQPSSGSLRSLHSTSNDGSADEEELDAFPVIGGRGGARRQATRIGLGEFCSTSLASSPLSSNPFPNGGHRPRASTCPETKAFRRRALARAMNRPPTPTPTTQLDDVQENVRSISEDVVYESSDDDEVHHGCRRSDDPTAATVRSVSVDEVDLCVLGRNLHIDVDEPINRTRSTAVEHKIGTARLPSLDSDVGHVTSVVDRRIVSHSTGKSTDRSHAGFGLTLIGGGCCGSSELLPVITETV